MTRIAWMAAVLGLGFPKGVSPDGARIAQAPSCRAVLEAQLPAPDSMVVLTPETQCGAVRLVLAGTTRQPPPGGWQIPAAVFEILVAIHNAGGQAIGLPLALSLDSITPVQRGRQLNALHAPHYVDVALWDGPIRQEPWRFVASRDGATALGPGERTEVRRLKVGVAPLTHGFRVWLKIRGPWPEAPDRPASPRPGWFEPQTASLKPAVQQLVRAGRFPKQQATRVLYEDRKRDLLIFDVQYGEGHDCVAGCFYSHAVGMMYGQMTGWMHVYDYEQGDSARAFRRVNQTLFRIGERDTYLLSGQLADTLGLLFGERSWLVEQVVLPTILRSPHVPRAVLARYVERLYSDVNQWRATLLIGLPKVLHDPGLLTLIAQLPNGGTAGHAAREALRRLGPQLARDPRASTRTLFLLAQIVEGSPADSGIRTVLLEHPKVRANPAILAIFDDGTRTPTLRAELLAAVQAPKRVKRMLADYLDHRWHPRDSSFGWKLLRDPEAGWNRDALLVLANLQLSNDQGIVWLASRRLPEGSLRRWEPDYIPLP
jgi:hypothetical protein